MYKQIKTEATIKTVDTENKKIINNRKNEGKSMKKFDETLIVFEQESAAQDVCAEYVADHDGEYVDEAWEEAQRVRWQAEAIPHVSRSCMKKTKK